MQELVLIVSGLALGFSLTVPPGPMNAFIASKTAAGGTRTGIIAGTGAMSADMLLGVAVYLARTFIDIQAVIKLIYIVGACVLSALAYFMLTTRSAAVDEEPKLRTYSTAVLMGITNPFQILWWLTAGLAFAYIGGITLLSGLFTAVAVWIVVFPVMLHLGTRRHPGASRAVTIASAIIMLLFAGYFIFSVL